MGQEISIKCPVCNDNKATYRDIFEAECANWEDFSRWTQKTPPFEEYLGIDCRKYILREKWLKGKDNGAHYDSKRKIVYWIFVSCSECIDIGDSERNLKFSEYEPEGVTIWRSQLP